MPFEGLPQRNEQLDENVKNDIIAYLTDMGMSADELLTPTAEDTEENISLARRQLCEFLDSDTGIKIDEEKLIEYLTEVRSNNENQ